MNAEFMQSYLRNAAGMLALISLEDLEAHVKNAENSLERWDILGAIVDPTEYHNSLQNGKREQAKTELAIVKHLLEVRRLIEALDIS